MSNPLDLADSALDPAASALDPAANTLDPADHALDPADCALGFSPLFYFFPYLAMFACFARSCGPEAEAIGTGEFLLGRSCCG